ncbi:MAG: cupin domain-containing protein [Kineosporiaceae bacterium]
MTRPQPPFASFHAALIELVPDPVDPARIEFGAPEVTSRELWASADGTVSEGIWQITPGVVTDVEAHESFVVLFGRATIESLDDPAQPPLQVGAGDHVTLRAGARTRWTVHETLRKVYLLRG